MFLDVDDLGDIDVLSDRHRAIGAVARVGDVVAEAGRADAEQRGQPVEHGRVSLGRVPRHRHHLGDPVGDDRGPVAVEDPATGGGGVDDADTLVLGGRLGLGSADDLQVPEPGEQGGEEAGHDDAEDRQADVRRFGLVGRGHLSSAELSVRDADRRTARRPRHDRGGGQGEDGVHDAHDDGGLDDPPGPQVAQLRLADHGPDQHEQDHSRRRWPPGRRSAPAAGLPGAPHGGGHRPRIRSGSTSAPTDRAAWCEGTGRPAARRRSRRSPQAPIRPPARRRW